MKKVRRPKCDCGHWSKQHYCGEGYCGQCACTWYHPNIKYIIAKRLRSSKE